MLHIRSAHNLRADELEGMLSLAALMVLLAFVLLVVFFLMRHDDSPFRGPTENGPQRLVCEPCRVGPWRKAVRISVQEQVNTKYGVSSTSKCSPIAQGLGRLSEYHVIHAAIAGEIDLQAPFPLLLANPLEDMA